MKDFKTSDAKLPCENCVIVWMQAGLEFLGGKQADVEQGMLLHHAVIHNDAHAPLQNCDEAKKRQKFFASGNERSVADLSGNGYGIPLQFLRFCKSLRMQTIFHACSIAVH
jgi:hypothetical protein